MPSATDKIQKLREETEEGEIPYLSKSRLKKWETCPRKFYYSYIEGRKGEETYAMKQGTRIHEVFEDYYNNVINYYQHKLEQFEENDEIVNAPTFPPNEVTLVSFLPDEVLRWADWREFIGNFIVWEIERADNSYKNNKHWKDALTKWLPVGIEEEAWMEVDEGPEWMGFADVIVHSSTVNEIDDNEGIVIVDFKTGKTPKRKYRNNGIFLEGEYYGMIFDDMYDVSGVAGFYPKNGDFLVTDLSSKRRKKVNKIIGEINEAVNNGSNKEDFEPDPQPLCAWSDDPSDRCDYYDDCPSTWAEPAKNRDVFEEMVNNGDNAYQVAEYLECEVNEVYYWARKFDLEL